MISASLKRYRHQHVARFAVPQQAVRVGEGGPEGNVARLVVEVGFDGLHYARIWENFRCWPSSGSRCCMLSCLASGFVVEVLGFGHVEVHPHFTVVGEGGQQIALITRLPSRTWKWSMIPLKGALISVKPRCTWPGTLPRWPFPVWPWPWPVRFSKRCCYRPVPWCSVFDFGKIGFGLGLLQFGLVQHGHDLEHELSLLDGCPSST